MSTKKQISINFNQSELISLHDDIWQAMKQRNSETSTKDIHPTRKKLLSLQNETSMLLSEKIANYIEKPKVKEV